MDASEPRVRRRGFFLHSETGETSDTVEHENPEGFTVRFRTRKTSRRVVSMAARGSGSRQAGRSHSPLSDEALPQIRSGSVTGSRQRAHLPR
jgi:hypothetical protein